MTDQACRIEDFETLVQPLVGLAVALPWKGWGSCIFLELGELALDSKGKDYERNKGQACIWIDWDWRVESGASVLYGSSNRGHKIERGIKTLLGTEIQSVSLVGQVPELVVRFSNGHCLRSMAMVTGDPEWTIRLSSNSWVFVKAGRLLVGEGDSGSTEEENQVLAVAESTAARWGVPRVEPTHGRCATCARFVQLDGEGHLFGYGACISIASPFDGRIVHSDSGCPYFTAHAET